MYYIFRSKIMVSELSKPTVVTEDKTTISISTRNRDRIVKLGTMQDNYNDVVTRILDYYESKNKPQ